MSAADWSTLILAFMHLVYGYPIYRFSGVGVAISAAVNNLLDHANGFRDAMRESRSKVLPIYLRCSSGGLPSEALNDVSNSGYMNDGRIRS